MVLLRAGRWVLFPVGLMVVSWLIGRGIGWLVAGDYREKLEARRLDHRIRMLEIGVESLEERLDSHFEIWFDREMERIDQRAGELREKRR